MLDEKMKNLKLSAVRALEEYLEVKQKEKVLLIFDATTKDIATAFDLAAKEIGLKITLHEIQPTGGLYFVSLESIKSFPGIRFSGIRISNSDSRADDADRIVIPFLSAEYSYAAYPPDVG